MCHMKKVVNVCDVQVCLCVFVCARMYVCTSVCTHVVVHSM